MMRRLFAVFLFLLGFFCQSAHASLEVRPDPNNPFNIQQPSVAAASITSTNGNVPNTATTVTFTAPSTHWSIVTSSGAANLYFTWTGSDATNSNAILYPGVIFNYNGPAVSAISILGASATGTYSVVAY